VSASDDDDDDDATAGSQATFITTVTATAQNNRTLAFAAAGQSILGAAGMQIGFDLGAGVVGTALSFAEPGGGTAAGIVAGGLGGAAVGAYAGYQGWRRHRRLAGQHTLQPGEG
jgi:hypothetical protein